jgi:serine/threonine protein kinase
VKVALRLVHPHIVTIRDFGEADGVTYYTMDFVEGRTLEALLEEEGALAPERALRLTRQVLDALATAHELGIIHRDMKPDNVLVVAPGTDREAAKVLDFGIAKFAKETGGLTGDGMIGTPVYMSPEQGAGKKSIDARADIYSVGVMLYHLLAGRPPFVSETPIGYVVQHQFDPPPPFCETAPGRAIPPEVEAIVMRALEKDPEKRFPGALAMMDAIDDLGIPDVGERRSAARRAPTGRLEAASATVPAVPALDWSKPLPGQVVDKYVLLEKLGEGGFGAVCLAQHSFLGRRVALKLLRPELSLAPEFIERFRREARIAAGLEHPAIVTIFDYGEAGGTCYLAMELLAGETLDAKLAREGALAPEAALGVLRPVLAALGYAHAHGIVHRDLKPENIMLLSDGRTKVLDFGIAKIVEGAASQHLTETGAFLGTPLYVAPEQVRGDPIDHRADLYACGVILFEALAGRPPFSGERPADLLRAHLQESPPWLRQVRPDLLFPEALEAVVARALAKDPASRFGSAAEMLAALEAALRPAAPALPLGAAPLPSGVAGVGSGAFRPGLEATRRLGGPGRWEIPLRARIDLASAEGRRTFFLFAGPSLPFGRARPGTEGVAVRNELVLRLLPCRSEALDPDNFHATRRISGHHGEFSARDGAIWLVDRGRLGTAIDGVPAPRDTPARLPARFLLEIAGALALEGEVRGPEGAAEALVLRRVGNQESHVYVWVLDRVVLDGPNGPAEVVNEGGVLKYAGPAGVRGVPFAPDDLCVAE